MNSTNTDRLFAESPGRRPKKVPTTAEMVEVATLFYKSKVPRKEIAGRLGATERQVTRILDAAVASQIVEFVIHGAREGDIKTRLTSKFPHLKDVLIAPGSATAAPGHCDELFRRFGTLAARYFEELHGQHPSRTSFHVGVAGGSRVLEFANAIPVRRRESVHFHVTALVGRGRLADAASHIEPTVTASILWTRCGSLPGHCEYETVEPFRSDEPGPVARAALAQKLDQLASVESVRQYLRELDHLDAVFAGFGFVNPNADQAIENRITMRSILESVITPQELADEGIVGDFCYCPFDANGTCPDARRWRFFLTAGDGSKHPGIAFYKHMVETGKIVVGFGGPYLVPVLRAALKGKIVNVLIVDEFSASQLADAD